MGTRSPFFGGGVTPSTGTLGVTGCSLPGHPVPCRVSISPEEPTVELGTSLLLNCTSSCGNYSRLSWEVSVTKMEVRGPGWLSLSIPNVTDWSLEIQCFGVFGTQRDITATLLRAYRKDRRMGRGGWGSPHPPRHLHPHLVLPRRLLAPPNFPGG